MPDAARQALIDPRRERAGFLNAAWLRATGRSWWQVRYANGRELSEWQTLRDSGDPTSSQWEQTDRRGMRALRLLCPNGEAGEVSARADHKLFQLKQGIRAVGASSVTLAHLVGVVTDANGSCDVFVWETPYDEHDGTRHAGRLVGPFPDNVLRMRYGQIGALGLDNLRLVL